MVHPVFGTPRPQIFPFPKDTMNYIFINAQPKHIRLLCQTCRLLTYKWPRRLVMDNLELSNLYKFLIVKKCSVKASAYNPKFWKSRLRKIYLLNKFAYEREEYTQFPYVLQRIEKCLIKELYLSMIVIKEKDFEFLTAEGTIEKLDLVLCEIHGSMPIDEIIKKVPKAYHISISPSYVSSKTSMELPKLKHRQKIKTLELFTIDELINVDDFWDFLLENLAPKAVVTIIYNFDVSSKEFFDLLKQMIECWEPFEEKPLLKC